MIADVFHFAIVGIAFIREAGRLAVRNGFTASLFRNQSEHRYDANSN